MLPPDPLNTRVQGFILAFLERVSVFFFAFAALLLSSYRFYFLGFVRFTRDFPSFSRFLSWRGGKVY